MNIFDINLNRGTYIQHDVLVLKVCSTHFSSRCKLVEASGILNTGK